MLDALNAVGVRQVTLVVGHCADQIRRQAGERVGRMAVRYIHNPDYTRGSVLSLYTARQALREPTLIMDADVLFPRDFLRRLLDMPAPSALLVDRGFTDTGEEVKIYTRGERVIALGKKVVPEAWDAVGEGIGFFKCGAEAGPELVRCLSRVIEESRGLGEWEDAINLAGAGPARRLAGRHRPALDRDRLRGRPAPRRERRATTRRPARRSVTRQAALYLASADDVHAARFRVAGRPVAFRVLVAAVRAGVRRVGRPRCTPLVRLRGRARHLAPSPRGRGVARHGGSPDRRAHAAPAGRRPRPVPRSRATARGEARRGAFRVPGRRRPRHRRGRRPAGAGSRGRSWPARRWGTRSCRC